jgi:hypothetical protein
VLVILGHSNDNSTRDLAHHLRGAVLTPADLASPGWILPFPCWEEGQGVIDGSLTPLRRITAIVTRLSRVALSDLASVRGADRCFAAREIHALLNAWLTQCRCPVINAPSGLSLSGEAAAPAAMPSGVSAASRDMPATQRLSISIIAGQVVELYSTRTTTLSLARSNGVAERIGEWAATIETPLVGVDMQVTDLGDWEMTKVHTLPRLTSRSAQDALRDYLGGRCGTRSAGS